jgi:epoxyqueuosine reductase
LRNAAIVLGNQRYEPAIGALCQALRDEEELVRGAAAWALGHIGGEQAREALRGQLSVETATYPGIELRNALEAIAS